VVSKVGWVLCKKWPVGTNFSNSGIRVGPIALSAEIFGLISCLIFGRKF